MILVWWIAYIVEIILVVFFSCKITQNKEYKKCCVIMGKTKFWNSWKKDRLWIVPLKNNVYEAMCRVCGDNLKITSGIGVTKTHEKRPKHLEKE